MSNPYRGEVEFKAGDETYKLAFTTNSICELETLLDKSINDIMIDTTRFSTVRAVLWAGLKHHHSRTITEAGEIMDEAGVPATADAIKRAITLAFPTGKANGKNPR